MSGNRNRQSPAEINYTSLGTSLGMLFGATLGVLVWLTTDTFVFFPVFIGSGLSVGLAIGMQKDKENES